MTTDIEASPAGYGDIDWAAMWQGQMDNASFKGQGASFWDNWGRTLPRKKEHSGYVEEVMSRLRIEPEYSVLDVGSGTGALTIPLARKARSVTALDHSQVLLDIVSKNAADEGLTNVHTLNLDWTCAHPGADFKQHDVVVVSRSLPSGDNISRCLKTIDASAIRSCYVTWKACSFDKLECELSRLLGINYTPFPEHVILYNLLHSLGIHAEVGIFQTGGCRRYETLEEACFQITRSHPLEQFKKKAVLDLLSRYLEYRDGAYFQPRNTLWALISWDKNKNSS